MVGWPDVALALIAAIPGIIAAFYSHRSSTQLKTDNGKTVGAIASEVHTAVVENEKQVG